MVENLQKNVPSEPFTKWKGLWLGEPQADPSLAPDVAGKCLFKTKKNIY